MADIGSLVVKISADASELAAELQKIGDGGKKASQAIQNAGKIMAGAFVAAASAAVYLTIQAGKQAEELDQLSQITGIHTDKLQGYEVAMNRVGLEGSDMTKMMRTLATNLEAAQLGTGTAADRFRQMGIDIRKVTDTDDLLRKIFNSVGKFADGTEKAAMVSDLLGKSGLKWIPAMKDGAKALDDAADKAARFGALTSDQIATLTAMDDAIDDLNMAWKFFAGNLGALLAPAIQWVTELFTNMLAVSSQALKDLREFLGMAGHAPPEASKTKPPAMVDSTKMAAGRMAQIDAQQKASEQGFANAQALGQAQLNYWTALQEQKKSMFLATEYQIAIAQRKQAEQTAKVTEANLEAQIRNYQAYTEAKKAAFTADAKGTEERKKFETEAAAHLLKLQTDLDIARVNGATAAVQATTRVAAAIRGEEIQALQDEVERYSGLEAIQQQYYEHDIFSFEAAAARRRVRIGAIEAETALERKLLDSKIRGAKEYADLSEAIDNKENARKMAAANEFPTFWEKQLDDVAKSNAFSISQIVSTWTSAIATMIVKGGDLKAAWEATQLALVQAALNTTVQIIADDARKALATEATATAMGATWEGFALATSGAFETVTAAFATMTATMVEILTAVGEAIMGVLSAIAEALIDTVFGSPWGVAILAGVIGIGIALGTLAAVGVFAEGGIVNSPMLGLVGEAGPEAIIPLDRMGDFGGGKGQVIQTTINIDGKRVARATSRYTASAWRAEGAGA